jgi:hypothetical protein
MGRAVSYNYEAVKIFMSANRSKPVNAPYIEREPPDGENGGGCCGPGPKENL